MAEPELSRDFIEFLECLKRHDVDFLIVGGWAVIAHGYPRTTVDYDVFVRRTLANAQRLEKALGDFFGSQPPGIQDASELLASDVIQFGVQPGRIDIVTRLDGIEDFEIPWGTRTRFPLVDGVFMIAIDHLIRNKRSTGRAQDGADAERLEQIVLRSRRH